MIQSKNKNSYLIAFVFALSIFAQSVLFHYLIYHEILFSTLWHSPEDFFRFYLPAATMAVFFGGLVFLFKNRWWTVAVSLLIDIWIFANLWYYRANSMLIDQFTVKMAGNMNGFWDSIFALIRPADSVFILLTIILIITIVFTNNGSKALRFSIICVILSLVMGLTNGVLLARKYGNDISYINPFKFYDINFGRNYLQEHTVIHHFAYTFITMITGTEDTNYTLTQDETNKVLNFINQSDGITPEAKHPIVICIIESLNSFAINEDIMPNLWSFVANNEHILFAPNITSMVKGGESADGQMLILSGLPPVAQGAACLRFPLNTYPSIPKLYKSTSAIFPHDLDVWNQAIMSQAYSIARNETASDNDKELFSKTVTRAKESDFVMMLTASTHIPCVKYADSSTISIPDTIPSLLKNYLKSANVLDQSIKILIDEIATDKRLSESTIIITGDHNLPAPSNENFNNAYNYSRFIPLIIYSPEIKQKNIITDTCYQMDIYPTLLHINGCEDYYWKGFGVNLLDSVARHNRPITAEEAYNLSDKLIRANYFNIL